jgi:hypothetical protein
MRLFHIPTFAVALAAASSVPAYAAPPSKAATAAPTGKSSHAPPMPDMAQLQAFFDKLFPPQPDPDPARLALARTSVQSMWPDGAYGKMMTGFMSGMFDRVMQLKESDLPMGKAKAASASAEKGQSIHDMAAVKDPYFDQRMAAMRGVVTDEVGKISVIIDPRMRDGLARSMARRFDARQLADINGFFATPSGRALAGQYMQLWFDPDTMRSLMSAMPEMVKLAPDIMDKMKAANDRFPAPPKPVSKPAKH